MSAPRHLALDCLHDSRVAVPQQERAVPHPVIYILVAVNIPLARAFRPVYIDRLDLAEVAVIVGDAAREDVEGTLVKGVGVRGI